MSVTDLASFPRPTLIDQVLTPRDPSCLLIFFAINQVEIAEVLFSKLFLKVSEILSIKQKLLRRRKKKSLDSLLYDSNNANDKSNSPRFTTERTHLHNP